VNLIAPLLLAAASGICIYPSVNLFLSVKERENAKQRRRTKTVNAVVKDIKEVSVDGVGEIKQYQTIYEFSTKKIAGTHASTFLSPLKSTEEIGAERKLFVNDKLAMAFSDEEIRLDKCFSMVGFICSGFFALMAMLSIFL